MLYTPVGSDDLVYGIDSGWNLISGRTFLLLRNEIGFNEVTKRTFFLNPYSKEYGKIEDINYRDFIDDYGSDDNYILNSAVWYFSPEKYEIRLNNEKLIMLKEPIIDFKLFRGWNFISFTDYTSNQEEDSIQLGDCDVELVYYFESQPKIYDWRAIEDFPANSERVGGGFIIKVTNNCNIGLDAKPVPDIPSLPN
tara:strand:- start:1074 stop:1658 length:585 start_codon:yes stop_codon:yes gene_type:complete